MAFPNCVPNFPGFRALYDALFALIPATAAPVPTDVGSANTLAVSGDYLICTEGAGAQVITLPAAPANGATVWLGFVVTAAGGTLTVNGNGKNIQAQVTGVSAPTHVAGYVWGTAVTYVFVTALDVWVQQGA